jgi:hypothetical protein
MGIAVALFAAVAATAGLSARPHTHSALCTEGFCLFAGLPVVARGVEAPQAAPDLLLVNGMIYTGDAKRPRAEAVAVRGEDIVAVGSTRELRGLAGPDTKVVDLGGKFALPGFNDAHIHLANGGLAKLAVDLTGARSIAEFQQRIRARVAETKAGEWVTGRGWDHTIWAVKRFPTRQDLDAVSREHPMIFTRVDGHVAVANSLALEKAGVKKDTPNPAGGEIERGADGEATGMLKERAAGLVRRVIPELTREQRRRGLEMALAEAVRHGITSAQDNSGWDDFLLYQQLKREGKLPLRITEWLPFGESVARLEQMRREGGTTDPWLKTGALKGVADGTLGSRTAAMLAPYADDPATSGIPIIPPDQLRAMVVERDKAGFQIAIHAIGDRANRAALDAYAAARASNGKRDARHKIEHAQVVAPEDFAKFRANEVIASMQPCHEASDMRWAGERLGPARSKGAYAWNTMLKNEIRLAFGSDYPVEPLNPLISLYACVTRQMDPAAPPGGPAGAWIPEERISIDACIGGFTQGSAYAEFEEKRKGMIAAGMAADIVVLSADVTQIAPPEILKTHVKMTFVGGKLAYERK